MHVPVSRLDPDNLYNADVATGITRDEVKFGKFIDRMRVRFSQLFIKVLEKHVVLKQILTIEDFQKVSPYLQFDFVKDNFFLEAKEQQILMARAQAVMAMMPFVGRYVSNDWMRRELLKQTDAEIEQQDELIAEEATNPQYQMAMGTGEDGQQDPMDDPNNPAVISDPNAFFTPPDVKPPKANGASNGAANGSSKPAAKKNPDKKQGMRFKNVASILSKGT